MKNILVTGANGQLGQSLKQLAGNYPEFNLLFTDYEDLDITDAAALDAYFAGQQIDACINCAAYTAVDKAESDEDKAFLLNFQAVLSLAEVCARYNAQLVHISTDYVFSGKQNVPYSEQDDTDPESIYGASKVRGEAAALGYNPSTIVIRTSWLYSEFAMNFVKRMKELMQERQELTVVFDQTGTPTYAGDLAKAILDILTFRFANPDTEIGGIYHYSNEGVTSWYDFAVTIKELTGATTTITPVTSDKYKTAAKRPAYSVLNKEKIKTTFGIQIPYWKDSLSKLLAK
ncbi:dTDP-4-dehydrorhamnose reductase [Chitinophaga terrae (ex Kim and Jung 2007)]|uniref:dTDP-4-dehydrorhamnose reductase n=1 Tax=Chitinophaga terrae (ex Kim and Jung 2007) TaxID=408074 RepID=A0A1H4FKK5_9BACT|nr:dTDP-4-dehydrorhamnose reductase [Chitinophaga terrae (ex Kim and Jung 2007)]GEP92473.1 NAD(P)-dependent oxidoreductase [Chitinophaga terrae (ex Kim and Jung 2007)]SEA97340.1 dTDP-4-dehydrorhamnose reductase [Chitinophaga terrae (ex Kim and Jung 2007)]